MPSGQHKGIAVLFPEPADTSQLQPLTAVTVEQSAGSTTRPTEAHVLLEALCVGASNGSAQLLLSGTLLQCRISSTAYSATVQCVIGTVQYSWHCQIQRGRFRYSVDRFGDRSCCITCSICFVRYCIGSARYCIGVVKYSRGYVRCSVELHVKRKQCQLRR